MACVICPTCSARYRLNDAQIAKANKLRCKKCEAVFTIQDNIEDEPSIEEPSLPSPPQPEETSPKSDSNTLDFNFSDFQFGSASESSEPEEEEPPAAQPGMPLDSSFGDLTLDLDSSSSQPEDSGGLDFSFNASVPEEDDGEDDEDIQDHINAPSFEEEEEEDDEGGLSGFSFLGGGPEDDEESGGAPSLDFSFSANIPQSDDVDEDDDELGLDDQFEDEEPEEEEEEEDDLPEEEEEEEEEEEYQAEEEEEEEEYYEEEELDTCCIDSLAMGLSRCEICGRDLQGKDRNIALELQHQRRQQLKDTLIASDTQVGFGDVHQKVREDDSEESEDFTDVERALDALADGTFHETIKKKEAKKSVAKTAKMVGITIVVGIIIAGGVFWSMLPSQHEKLLERYQTLTKKTEIDARQLVTLFLDAAIAQDQDIIKRISIMSKPPNINSGRVVSVGEEYEQVVIGKLGQNIATLREEIAALEKELDNKTILLNKYSAKNLSSSIVQGNIDLTSQKIEALQAQFDERHADMRNKMERLQQDLDATSEDIRKQRAISRKYVTATDTVGKALYDNSVSKQKFLETKKEKLELQMRDEKKMYAQNKQQLDAEFTPQFADLDGKIAVLKGQLEEARLLEDKKNSPVRVLTNDIEKMSKSILDKKSELGNLENQFTAALTFFIDNNQRNQITKQQQDAEFSSISKNVAAAIKYSSGAEKPVSVILKRYSVQIGDQTLEGNWLVEKLAQ